MLGLFLHDSEDLIKISLWTNSLWMQAHLKKFCLYMITFNRNHTIKSMSIRRIYVYLKMQGSWIELAIIYISNFTGIMVTIN